MKRKNKQLYRSNDLTYYSFFFLGLLWLAQLCPLMIASVLVNESFTGDLGIWVGIAHAGILLVAAYEDFRYDTRHLPWIIVLAVIMNWLLGILAAVGMWLIIAAVITVAIIYIFLSGPFAMLLTLSFAGIINLGSILMVLFIIVSIITGVLGLNWFL